MSTTIAKLGAEFNSRGFVLSRRLFTTKQIWEISAAYDRLMTDAPRSEYFGSRGSRCVKEYLGNEPTLDDLVDHPAIHDITALIDGIPALYTGAGAAWYMLDDVPWHCDGTPGREAMPIKVSVYLDELSELEGAFRLLPGTHIPDRCTEVMEQLGVWKNGRPRIRPDVPRPLQGELIIKTKPGDVLFWDNRVWHAAPRRADGLGRRAIFINYTKDPRKDALAIQRLREDVADTLSKRRKQFIYPFTVASKLNLHRQRTIRRLQELGVAGVVETER